MNKNTKIWFAIMIGIISLLIYLTIQNSGGSYDEFAQCLTDNNVKMYGAYWCPHCAAQKDLFGSSFKNINYIECSLPEKAGQTQICMEEGIQTYPTWEFADSSRSEGVQSLEQLRSKTGCSLN